MLKKKTTNTNALGIIFPNSYDSLVPELTNARAMAAIPFASRYRLIDFMLSNMVNSGITNVSVIVKKNYHSLMDHLGNGGEWDLTRKNGGLNIVPPLSEKQINVYEGRVDAVAAILDFLRSQKEEYVIMADAHFVASIDLKAILNQHIESGAEVTVAYKKGSLPNNILEQPAERSEMYYAFDVENDNITKVHVCPKQAGDLNLSLNIYVVKRELLIDMISNAFVNGLKYFERDLVLPLIGSKKIMGYEVKDYVATIYGIKSYYDANMALLNENNSDALFKDNRVYTKIRDDNPTRYAAGSSVSNTMAADGCVIEGVVENSVLFRGVVVKKGAVVRNSVLMQDTVVEEGARVEYTVADKNVTVTTTHEVKGTDTFPTFIPKGKTV